jgi:uncharacterized membrane protein YhhN
MTYNSNLKQRIPLLYSFAVLSGVNLVAVFIGLEWLNFVTKPLLVSCLALWFYLNSDNASISYSKAFLTGLGFSVLGDVLLMFVKSQGELYFMLGLGSFLFAHLCYISAFTLFPSFKTGSISLNKLAILPFVAVFIGATWLLWDDLGALRIPVIVYSFVIITMATFSFNMKNRVKTGVFSMLFYGAILFVSSDFAIALSKFKYHDIAPSISGLVIMVTYLFGQFLLTRGMEKAVSQAKAS